MGRFVFVATGPGGIEAVAVTEVQEPQAVVGSELHRLAYPKEYAAHEQRKRELKAYAAYSFNTGRTVNTITARLDNATNALYRNHLSLIKELVPEMGRNVRLLYNVRF